MPLVLPLVFFFSDSFYSIAFFFLFWFVLSLSLYWFWSSVFFSFSSVFVCLCFFSDQLFKRGEPGGLVYLEAKLVLLRWLASAFLSLFLFFLRLLSDLPSLGLFFFCPFVLLCLLVLPFAFCVYPSLPVFCVSTLCLSPVLVFVRPLFILGVLSIFFPFVFVLCSCLSNGMHRGGEKDVTMICCHFRWIGMKEINSLLWNGAVLS